MSGIGHRSGACGDARASGPVSFRERDNGRQEELVAPHLCEDRTKSSKMYRTSARLTWAHLLSRPVSPPVSARARRCPFAKRFVWVALFSRKDWRFQMAFSDKKGENRFIFFSGVVHQTTPFFSLNGQVKPGTCGFPCWVSERRVIIGPSILALRRQGAARQPPWHRPASDHASSQGKSRGRWGLPAQKC
jgi:hypothetical protein